MDPRPDRPDRDGEGVGDLFVAEADDVAEDDRRPEFLGQAAEGGLDVVGKGLGRLVGTRAGREQALRVVREGPTGRRRRRRTSSRKTFVTIRDNQASIDPGW